MLHWQIMLELAWSDLRTAGLEWCLTAVALGASATMLTVVARGVIKSLPPHWDSYGILWGWLFSVATFVAMKITYFGGITFQSDDVVIWGDWFFPCFIVACVAGAVTSGIYLWRQAGQQPVAPEGKKRRWIFSLRTVVISQLALAVIVGPWTVSLRQRVVPPRRRATARGKTRPVKGAIRSFRLAGVPARRRS